MLKNIITTLLLIGISNNVCFANSDYYLGVSALTNNNLSQKYSYSESAFMDDSESSFDNLVGYSIKAGYVFANNFRGEVEYLKQSATYSSNDKFSLFNGGSIDTTALVANIIYDLKNPTIITPYFGIGGGMMNISSNTEYINDSNNTAVGQILTGIQLDISPSHKFNIGYRMLATDSYKAQDFSGNYAKTDFRTGTFEIGYSFYF